MSSKRKRSVLPIKDKNEDADDIVLKKICKIVVSRLNVVFLIQSVLLDLGDYFEEVLLSYPDHSRAKSVFFISSFFKTFLSSHILD